MSKFWYVVISEHNGTAYICSPPMDYMESQKWVERIRIETGICAKLHAVSQAEANRIAKAQSTLKPNEALAYGKPQLRHKPIVKTDWPRCLLSLTWYARFVSRAWKSFISIS